MERYLQIAGAVLAIAAFVPAVFFFVQAVTHFLKMLPHVRSPRQDIVANLLPFLMPFMSRLFTEEGNVHRRRFVTNMVAFVCCAVFIGVIYALLGISGGHHAF